MTTSLDIAGLFDAVPSALLELDANGRVLRANPAACCLLQRNPPELHGGMLADLAPAEEREIVRDFLRRRILGGDDGSAAILLQIPCFDGTVVTAEMRASRRGDAEGLLATLVDVTERQRLRGSLQETESRYRAIFDNAPDPMFTADLNGSVIEANPAFEQLLGCQRGAASGMNLSQVLTPESATLLHRMTACEFQGGRQGAYDLALCTLDGRELFVEARTEVLVEGGRESGIRGTLRDATARVNAERALQASIERFELAARGSRDGMWEWDFSAGTAWVSSVGQRQSGFEQPSDYESSRALWERLLHPEDRHRVLQALNDHLERRVPYEVEYRACHPSGEFRWYAIRGQAIWDEQGQPVRIAGSVRDVTSRKETEERLRAATELIQGVIQNSPVATCALDVDCKVTLWNPAAVRVFGWEESEVLGHFLPTIRPEDRVEFQQSMEVHGRGLRTAGREFRRLRKDGSEIDVAVWAAPLQDSRGQSSGTVALLLDLTERKMLEAQLRQAQKMDAIGQLAGGIAHDFNNLLTVISGHASLMLGSAVDADSLQEQTREIAEAADRARALTQQLLAFSRKEILKPEVLDLNAVVRELETMLRRLIGEQIGLESDLSPDVGNIRADPGQILQLILNLAINARDAMPGGGKLTLRTTRREGDGGPWAVLVVGDTGCGMTREVQNRIFEPFFSTKQKGEGTGLGLSTVYGIVQSHDGRIQVDSEPGRGSTFTVLFPVTAEPTEILPARPDEEPAGGSETILVVEDETSVRALVSKVLSRHGYTVLSAATAAEALLLIQWHRSIDLLISDIVMPEVDGRELVQQVLAVRPEIRVLYMTGYTDDEAINHGVLIGEVQVIEKPFRPEELLARVREVLSLSLG